MTGSKEDKKTLYITHSGELLIWLIVLLIVVSVSSLFYMHTTHIENDYNIYLQDVDGLIVGSPVRMMGIEVGHVTKIKPTNEEIYVKFIISDKNLKLPQGTKATVEFSGMAGSKSLEIYLPDKNSYIDKNTPILTVNPPKRLHDALGLLNDMFEKLGSIIYTTSSFGEQLKFINIPTSKKEENIEGFLEYTDDLVDTANDKANKFRKKLNEVSKNDDK